MTSRMVTEWYRYGNETDSQLPREYEVTTNQFIEETISYGRVASYHRKRQ